MNKLVICETPEEERLIIEHRKQKQKALETKVRTEAQKRLDDLAASI